jgi:pSer/pThr/pTyr-binding forkhead associated (FHA) protein
MRSYLFTVLEGPDIGRCIELPVGRTILGRLEAQGDEEEGVFRWTLIDKTVSRAHAEISLADPGVPILKHLSATNDTFVDGRKVSQENLQDGQIIRMGQTVVVMEVLSNQLRRPGY